MNIGIVTFHAVHNYGAMFQATGLKKTLEQLGHKVTFVHLYSKSLEDKNRRRSKVKNIKGLTIYVAQLLLHSFFKRRFARFDEFMHAHIPLTKRYYSREELSSSPPVFEAYICGSDQIWNFTNGADPAMFLQFAPTGAKKIAYAPSFGRDVVDKKIFPQLAQYLSTFSAISIRENTGVAIIKEITGKNVPQLLDPVFLTGKEYWYSLLKAPNFKKPYIAYYSLEMTNTMEKAVHHLAKKLNLPVVILGKAGLLPLKCKTIIAIDAGPQEALGWFQNAAMICTNSFHAVAFSLIFEKPFVVVPHSSRNTRISSLLELADLTSRILPDHAQLSEITAEQLLTIDFTNWKSTLAVELEKSLAYLKNNLRQ